MADLLHDEIPLGLTFDDVLLQPLEFERAAERRRHAHLPDPRDPAQHSDPVVGDGHGDRRRHGDRAWPSSAASACSTATWTIDEQAAAVRAVKRFESGMVVNPITMTPEQTLAEALELMRANRISGIPIVEKSGKLAGILTNRDVRFAENPKQPVSELMTKDNLATVGLGTSQEVARRILHQRRIEKLLVVDDAAPLRRPDHRQGYREGGRFAARDQGCAGPAARRRRDHGRRQGLRAIAKR